MFRQIIIIIVVCFSVFLIEPIQCQRIWAPEEAEWHYSFNDFFSEGYIHVYNCGDTIVDGKVCQMLYKESILFNHLTGEIYTSHIYTDIVFSDSNDVYLFTNNKFYILYSFDSDVGDVFEIPINNNLPNICDSTGFVEVKETGFVNINGQNLRRIVLEPYYNSHWSYTPGEVIERIGPTQAYMIPEPTPECVTDLHEGGPLRCYQDSLINTYSTGISLLCDYIVSTNSQLDESPQVFPNPTSGIIQIMISQKFRDSFIQIYTLEGIEVKVVNAKIGFNITDISELPTGVYLLRVTNNSYYLNQLIIKI